MSASDNLKNAFYSLRDVEFVEVEKLTGKRIKISVGVPRGRFEAIAKSNDDVSELIDLVDVHVNHAISDKKRSVEVKFISNNSEGI